MEHDILGIRNINPGIGSAGVGWVVVPEGADRDTYIQDCYRNNTLTINAGIGYGFFSNVYTDQEVMQNIVFPDDEENRGSAVVWIRDEVSNLPIIVASLRKQDDYYILNKNQYRVARGTEETSVEVFLDGDTSTLHINVVGNRPNPAKLNIKLASENQDSVFNIDSDNELNVFSEKKIQASTNGVIDVQIKKDGEIKTEFQYESGKGLTYKDEFENEINVKDGEIDVVSKKINHNTGKEPMVLGDTLADILKDLCKALQQLTVMTSVGTSSIPVNVADFAAIQAKIDTIKSKKSNLE